MDALKVEFGWVDQVEVGLAVVAMMVSSLVFVLGLHHRVGIPSKEEEEVHSLQGNIPDSHQDTFHTRDIRCDVFHINPPERYLMKKRFLLHMVIFYYKSQL